mmetsp:Transcript_66862/g.131794  ORF Transcript_66862/g.131794 Transcript_66862/m.131794 type:complete len:104 (+) Transcript_66862:306-617(+)
MRPRNMHYYRSHPLMVMLRGAQPLHGAAIVASSATEAQKLGTVPGGVQHLLTLRVTVLQERRLQQQQWNGDANIMRTCNCGTFPETAAALSLQGLLAGSSAGA